MSDNEDETNFHSDDEVNPQAHKKLLQAVSRIGKTQFIKKPSRSEPVLSQDEFHLVKSTTESVGKIPESAVYVNDLVNILNKTSKHLAVGKELKNTRRSKKVLQKPLERPVAERIQRTIGYEKLKKDLSKWDAVVARNRVAEQQVFPLNYEEIHVDIEENKKPPEIKIKSALRREFEAIQAEYKAKELVDQPNDQENDKNLSEKLTKEKLHARRKELAYLRIRESQKSAKARYQNKIKSKKYHKLLKRQKFKEQLKEFEILQKENPEKALEQLEKIEKNRVLERANLRHKNTGTWAKNLQIRAKYDRDVRKDLAEQLAISRELTAKVKEEDDDESEDESVENADVAEEVDPFNPWAITKKKTNEVMEFVSGYRKYWVERNKAEVEKEKYKSNENSEDAKENEIDLSENNEECNGSLSDNSEQEFQESVLKEKSKKKSKNKKNVKRLKKIKKEKNETKSKLKKIKVEMDSGWEVEDYSKTSLDSNTVQPLNNKVKDIDDIFDEAEDLVQEKIARKLKKLSETVNVRDNKTQSRKNKRNKTNYLDLSFKQQATRPEFDEELLETSANTTSVDVDEDMSKKVANVSNASIESVPDKHVDHIDPENIQTVKAKTFHTDLSDIANSGEFFDEGDGEDAEVDKQITLAQVFEDDDFNADFEKERDEERKKNSIEEIDLTLPGWGSWAGCGISKDKQKKRFVLKFPKEEKRRDENKEKVYINENVNKKLKQHLVSDLPFPFTSVKDYEASIRAPIGPEFVPETAFRMLTRPSIITKMGQIIEPMDKDILVKPPKRPRTVVDARIEALNKTSKK